MVIIRRLLDVLADHVILRANRDRILDARTETGDPENTIELADYAANAAEGTLFDEDRGKQDVGADTFAVQKTACLRPGPYMGAGCIEDRVAPDPVRLQPARFPAPVRLEISDVGVVVGIVIANATDK